MDFLYLIAFVEQKLKIKIDLSSEDPNIFSKTEKLILAIYKNKKLIK